MCFVADFICFPAVQKIFENLLRSDKVTESSKVGTFFETQCSMAVKKLHFQQFSLIATIEWHSFAALKTLE